MQAGGGLRRLLPALLLAAAGATALALALGERDRPRSRAVPGAPPALPGSPPGTEPPPAAGEERPLPESAPDPAAFARVEDDARGAAAAAVQAPDPETAARLAEAALEAATRQPGDWRTARIVLERVEWLAPEARVRLEASRARIRNELERALVRAAGAPPTEETAEALALACTVGGERVAGAALDFLRLARRKPPTTREEALVRERAALAALLHGGFAVRDEAHALVEEAIARAKDEDERAVLRAVLVRARIRSSGG